MGPLSSLSLRGGTSPAPSWNMYSLTISQIIEKLCKYSSHGQRELTAGKFTEANSDCDPRLLLGRAFKQLFNLSPDTTQHSFNGHFQGKHRVIRYQNVSLLDFIEL